MALDLEVISRLYLGAAKSYPAELISLAKLCCIRHDAKVAANYTARRAATTEIDGYYDEAVRLGFEGSRVIWRRYVVVTREIEL